MRNQIILKMFCFIFLILLNSSLINCTSLIGSRITFHKNVNRIFHASLTDKDTGRVWQIQEDISTEDPITGRIEIRSTNTEANVFYSYRGRKDNKKRLVLHDNTCDVFNYNSKWDNLLPGVNKPLTNLILLVGPSIVDRFENFNWQSGNDEVIRGTVMHSVSTNLDDKLNITLYYENNLNQVTGIQQPSQIVFTGYNPDVLVDGSPETLILDIYLQSQVQKKLEKTVQITPGFGCPVYLNGDKDFPELNSLKIHFIATEQVNKKEAVTNEYHADETYQLLRESQLRYGFKYEKLFDFSIGAYYAISSSGSCYITPMDSNTPGIDESGSLSLSKLLWLTKTMKYLGEIIFEKRSGYNVHVWESVDLNKAIGDKTYDKVVTTQYMSSSYKDDIFKGYSPVAATINAYTKNDKGAYILSTTIHRDYYDSNSDLPESAYHEALQIEDCFERPDQRLTLKFHLTCQVDGCIKKSQDSVYKMRELFKSSLLGQLGMSSNRVSDIDFKFQQDIIEVLVTFVEAPRITDALPVEVMTLQPKSIASLHETSADSETACLQYHSSFVPAGAAIIFCKADKVCMSVTSEKDVKRSSTGSSCYVFTDPYKKLNRLGQEKPLKDLHDHILGYFGHITFKIDLDDKNKAVSFQIDDVIAVQQDIEEASKFQASYSSARLDPIDDVNIVLVPGVERFGDCYHACTENEDIPCESFSFCNGEDKKCIVSTLFEKQFENNHTDDSNCFIYRKNNFYDYEKRPNLKYKNPSSVAEQIYITDCAAQCYASPDCVTFEHCNGMCTFGGLFTESNTEYSDRCDIYTPKSSLKYKVTGKKLVSQALYTELDLDLDQCATLCENDLKCVSFNYCPKSKASSQCQITSSSVKNPKTESVESSICHNFEPKQKRDSASVIDNSPAALKASGISGGGVFGIVTLFLFIGLFAGFVGPYVFTKVKSKETDRPKDDFGWQKQKDDDDAGEDATQI